MPIKNNNLRAILNKIINKKNITKQDSFFLVSRVNIWDLLYGAYIIREHFFDNKIHLCSIINAKSGNCSEDCKFCAQSSRHATKIKTYKLVSSKIIKEAYFKARRNKADGFSIVTSGNKLSTEEIDRLSNTVHELCSQNKTPYLCLSVGRLSPLSIAKLKESGITKCHHNLETSRSFFPKICSTHSYSERVATIVNLKKANIKVCSGGIFGLGEGWKDRIDLAFTLKDLNVDSVPLNFLMPAKGTSLDKLNLLSPMEALRIIAIFRYILPDKDIRICAGREKVLRNLQPLMFYAGATGMMIGGYLTQPGRGVADDFQMLNDLGVTD
ncbi:MAG: biotin synthase BioB [Planctomycetota bacterium]